MVAWKAVQLGEPNPLIDQITNDETFRSYLDETTLRELMDASDHVGDAPERARLLARELREKIAVSN